VPTILAIELFKLFFRTHYSEMLDNFIHHTTIPLTSTTSSTIEHINNLDISLSRIHVSLKNVYSPTEKSCRACAVQTTEDVVGKHGIRIRSLYRNFFYNDITVITNKYHKCMFNKQYEYDASTSNSTRNCYIVMVYFIPRTDRRRLFGTLEFVGSHGNWLCK